jgi:hypothetical protein
LKGINFKYSIKFNAVIMTSLNNIKLLKSRI